MADLFKAATAILGLLLVVLFGVGLVVERTGLFSGSTRQADPQAAATLAPASRPAIPALDVAAPTKTETATFALGWFWGPDSQFGSLPGVVRTRVGYAGGSKANPTYRDLGDHSETIQIDYDPAQISYQELLDVFWSSHSPTARSWSRQYASIIFYHNQEQKRLAEASRDREAARRGSPIYTEIVPFAGFHLAESYHQKYRLQQVPALLREFRALYPQDDEFVDSTAAARVNGYLGGYGTLAALQADIEDLGLSLAAQQKLLDLVSGGSP
jgi:peptide-methionine (S)-S-oxide reductase